MIREIRPLASVLATPRDRESGWLTCKKLILERPNLKVILVESNPTAATTGSRNSSARWRACRWRPHAPR